MERKRPYTIRIRPEDQRVITVCASERRMTKSKWLRHCAARVIKENVAAVPEFTIYDSEDSVEICFGVKSSEIETWRFSAKAKHMSLPEWFRDVVIPWSKKWGEELQQDPLPAELDERVVLAVGVRAEQRITYEKAAMSQHQSLSEWVRAALDMVAIYHLKNPKP